MPRNGLKSSSFGGLASAWSKSETREWPCASRSGVKPISGMPLVGILLMIALRSSSTSPRMLRASSMSLRVTGVVPRCIFSKRRVPKDIINLPRRTMLCTDTIDGLFLAVGSSGLSLALLPLLTAASYSMPSGVSSNWSFTSETISTSQKPSVISGGRPLETEIIVSDMTTCHQRRLRTSTSHGSKLNNVGSRCRPSICATLRAIPTNKLLVSGSSSLAIIIAKVRKAANEGIDAIRGKLAEIRQRVIWSWKPADKEARFVFGNHSFNPRIEMLTEPAYQMAYSSGRNSVFGIGSPDSRLFLYQSQNCSYSFSTLGGYTIGMGP